MQSLQRPQYADRLRGLCGILVRQEARAVQTETLKAKRRALHDTACPQPSGGRSRLARQLHTIRVSACAACEVQHAERLAQTGCRSFC